MVSTIFQSPMRWPSRLPLQHVRAGAHVLLAAGDDDLAVAPATACAASITAFRPEPQTLLMVIAGTAFPWQAGLDHGLAGRVLAHAGGQHLAQDDFADLVARPRRCAPAVP
jgi:hypothetical protein